MDHDDGWTGAGEIRVATTDGRTVIHLLGEVDAALRDQAGLSMGQALTAGLPIVLDSTRTTFIDSAGLAFVVQLHVAAGEAGIPVMLHDPARVLGDMLEMIGFHDRITPAPA